MLKSIKIIIGVSFSLTGLILLFNTTFIGGFLISLSGLLILPSISNSLNLRVSFWQRRRNRISSIILIFILGFLLCISNTDYEAVQDKKRKELIIEYIRNNDKDNSLKNLKILTETGNLFGNNNYSLIHPKNYITFKKDSISGVTSFLFQPEINFDKAYELDYLLSNKQNKLNNYSIILKLDSEDSLIVKQTILEYENYVIDTIENDKIFSINEKLNNQLIKTKKSEIELEKLVKAEKEEYEKRVKKFGEDCLSGWDGSHSELKDHVKRNLNDPSSFEHVETSFILKEGYAVVIMSFRAKNAFGGLVKNSISGKVKLNDCSLIEIIS